MTGVNAVAAEEPQYDILLATEDYEIRRYDPASSPQLTLRIQTSPLASVHGDDSIDENTEVLSGG
jgi:hypothetical protein